MAKNICLYAALLMILLPRLHAAKKDSSSSYVQGTVVKVRGQKVYSPSEMVGGSNPSDAPLTTRFYAYEVAIRVDCKIYVGRYETPFNYLPSSFTADHPIRVRLTKHVMYFDLPNDPDMRMGIVRRKSECGEDRQ